MVAVACVLALATQIAVYVLRHILLEIVRILGLIFIKIEQVRFILKLALNPFTTC